MAQPSATLKLMIDAGPEADDEELEKLGARLRAELLELGVDAVDRVRTHSAREGARGDSLTLGALVVTLAPAVLTALVQTIQTWLTRHDRASVTVESGGEKIVITGSPSKEQQRLMDAWIARHKG